MAALTAAVPALALAEAWLAQHNGPQQQATAKQWLQGRGSAQQIRTALSSVLARIWQQGFGIGLQAAKAAGISAAVLAALMQGDILKHLSSDWLDEITDTRLDRLSAVLAKGGTVSELQSALLAVLSDDSAANTIALTELGRADNAARFAAFHAARVRKVRWVTTSGNPCQRCIDNEAAGPWPLGHPFPSGAIAPPDHPNCQCYLEPADL